MAKKFVTAVFDRRKEVEKKGTGSVEILIYVSLKCRKLIPMKRVTPQEWLAYQDSKELNEAIGRYEAHCLIDGVSRRGNDPCKPQQQIGHNKEGEEGG